MSKTKQKEQLKTVNIPEDAHRAAKIEATKKGMKLKNWLAELIRANVKTSK